VTGDPTATPTIRGISCVIAHTPGLVRYGSKPTRELQKNAALDADIRRHLRSFSDAVAYGPNQVFIGNHEPEWLWDVPEPWWRHGDEGARAEGPAGRIVSEEHFWGLLRMADDFGVLDIERSLLERSQRLLAETTLFRDAELDRVLNGHAKAQSDGAMPLHAADGGAVGQIANGYPGDSSQTADILLENLACKASGALALKQLFAQLRMDPNEVEYVLGCGEEAVGDRYQRGGGAIAKAMAEMAGCGQASGSDVKAFCCAPVHALVMAGALVQSGIYRNVVVVGGGSLAKLGMKLLGHLAKDMPLLEDSLAAVAILVAPGEAGDVRMRLDAVGRHTVASGGSAPNIYDALVAKPLDALGLKVPDVAKYAVELHNPEITVPAGSGNVPRTNYRIIAALGVQRGELKREEIDGFERAHGMPGFVPTQGHIPAALPYLAHALPKLRDGSLRNALFIAKGSLFLGKMTNMADGMSVLLEHAD
jgi:betaine reductase